MEPDGAEPAFADLPELETGERHAWDRYGRHDEVGRLNSIGPAEVIAAAQEVTAGRIVNLNLPLGEPSPQFWAARPALSHQRVKKRNIRDDYVDNFAMQGSTQWDGLKHQRYREFGFYGGRQDEDVDAGALGIERWAERGIVGRGVLADVAGYRARRDEPLDPQARFPITGELLADALADQGTDVRQGDILLVRSGWLGWYMNLASDTRNELAEHLRTHPAEIAIPGIDPKTATVEWIWDNGVAAVALDNPTAETVPFVREEGWAHHRLLALLGIPLGELWALDELASVCAELGRFSFLLSCSPLFLRGGAGSPANAYAVL
jgi:kynurenine formamidase